MTSFLYIQFITKHKSAVPVSLFLICVFKLVVDDNFDCTLQEMLIVVTFSASELISISSIS